MLVADGSIDIAVEVGGLTVWDLAAVAIVVEEAGGRFTDLAAIARVDGGDVVSTNGLLHDDVVAAFARRRPRATVTRGHRGHRRASTSARRR